MLTPRRTNSAATIIASFFYIGFVPIVPGTFGSLAAFLPYFGLLQLPYWPVYLMGVTIIIVVGVWAAGKAEHESEIVDPSFVVIDEVAGQLLTLFAIPFSMISLVAGFVIFRALDIVKPFPARRAENLPGGWGIMLDDVIAGLYGNILLRGVLWAWERYGQ